jgi:hypothetical protein
VSFSQFVETGVPTVLTARVDLATPDRPVVDVVIAQNRTACGTATLQLALRTGN